MTLHRQLMAAAGSTSTGTATYVEDVFNTYLYNGTGASQTITNGIDLATNGGMVWLKCRTLGASRNSVYDTLRGSAKVISTNESLSQYSTSSGGLQSFTSSGFSLGQIFWDENNSGQQHVAWTFRKQAKFFTICTWTGDGTAGRQISHDLGATPGMIIVKSTSAAYNWRVYHKSIGATQFLALNTTDAATTLTGSWNNTEPTSSVFTLGNSPGINESGQTYVAYLFADSNSGGFGAAGTDSVVACGSFTEPASGYVDVNLGWEPQYILFKPTSTTGNWFCMDTMRGFANSYAAYLYPNTSGAEVSGAYDYVIPTATGFKYKAGFFNNGASFIYLAIRRGPMKTPTDATKVFAPVLQNGGGTVTTNFPVDMVNIKQKDYTGGIRFVPRLTNGEMYSSDTSAESAASYWKFDNSKAFVDAGLSTSIPVIYWNFRRAPGFFDVVCYTGTGDNQSVTHNLGVVPQLIIVKRRSGASSWFTYNATSGVGKYLMVNDPSAVTTLAAFMSSVTSTAFVPSTDNTQINLSGSGSTYVAYLFATCSGVSKCGSYTGSGTTKQIDCGFASGARFVLIKRTDSTGDWYCFDTARGLVSGNDPYLLLNSTAAEVTTTDYIDPYSAGFEISSTAPAALNANGGSYIFLAIA